MFENVGSLRMSVGGARETLRLESLEDRTTPAAVATTATSGVALDISNLAQSPYLDEAFLAESARLDLIQAWLGMEEVGQGADTQIRAFAQRLLTDQLNALNQINPTLAQVGISIQLTPFDLQLAQEFPGLKGTTSDGQFLALSTMNSVQSAALDRTEAAITSNSAARAFAQTQLVVVEQEELTEVTLLGSAGLQSTASLFQILGGDTATTGIGSPATTGFGAIGATGSTGFGTIGLNATGTFGTATTTAVSATNALGTANAIGTGATGGSGPGVPFGESNGFGPGAPFGEGDGFGPGVPFGEAGGYGPASTVGL